jgi:hypothetical protein
MAVTRQMRHSDVITDGTQTAYRGTYLKMSKILVTVKHTLRPRSEKNILKY